jgi:hypothetical protein
VLSSLRELILREQLGQSDESAQIKSLAELLPQLLESIPSMDGGSIKTASFLLTQVVFIAFRSRLRTFLKKLYKTAERSEAKTFSVKARSEASRQNLRSEIF